MMTDGENSPVHTCLNFWLLLLNSSLLLHPIPEAKVVLSLPCLSLSFTYFHFLHHHPSAPRSTQLFPVKSACPAFIALHFAYSACCGGLWITQNMGRWDLPRRQLDSLDICTFTRISGRMDSIWTDEWVKVGWCVMMGCENEGNGLVCMLSGDVRE